jgi:hypothetical protein
VFAADKGTGIGFRTIDGVTAVVQPSAVPVTVYAVVVEGLSARVVELELSLQV